MRYSNTQSEYNGQLILVMVLNMWPLRGGVSRITTFCTSAVFDIQRHYTTRQFHALIVVQHINNSYSYIHCTFSECILKSVYTARATQLAINFSYCVNLLIIVQGKNKFHLVTHFGHYSLDDVVMH